MRGKLIGIVGAVLFILSASAQAEWSEGVFFFRGGSMRYSLYAPRISLPSSSEGGTPLAVYLHGCNQTPEEFYRGAKLEEAAEKFGTWILVPHQRENANPENCWNWYLPFHQTRWTGEPDVLNSMVHAVVLENFLDPDSVWISGMSSGAAMANILISCFPETFKMAALHSGVSYLAATDPVSALWSIGHGSTRLPEWSGFSAWACSGYQRKQPPLIVIHGSQDQRVVPIHADQTVRQFLVKNDFADDGFWNGSTQVRGPILTHSDSVGGAYPYRVEDYSDSERVRVRNIFVQGLGHSWSGGDARYPRTDALGPDFTKLSFEFWREQKASSKGRDERGEK